MAANAGNRDPLEALDSSVPSGFYWQLTILATIGGFLFGYDTANIGSALSFVPYKLPDLALGYLVAGTSIGAAVGAISAGFLTDRFGRKSMLVIDAGIFGVGAILSAVTWHPAVLIFARTLIGLAIGADSAIATAYISEYAPQKRRGALGMLQQWMITVGILVAYVIALVVLKVFPGSAFTADWRVIFGLGAIPALVGFVMRTQMPESPRWLLRKGRFDKAQQALGKLGVEVSEQELQGAARKLEEKEDRERRSGTGRWATPGVRRALFVVCGFMVFQQITGINIPFYYGPKLLTPLLGAGSSKVDSAVAAVEVTTLIAIFNVAATYFAFRFIDAVGRRKLSMAGFAGMALFMVVGAIGLAFAGGGILSGKVVVVTGALILFVVCFAIGVGGTGWLIQGEVFPTPIRGQAAAYGATADWIANFAIILVFPLVESRFGLGPVMVGFGVLSVLAVAFVFSFLPETKELSVDEIVQLFERSARERKVVPAGG